MSHRHDPHSAADYAAPSPRTPDQGSSTMPLDPYVSCPCGSGKKFKWCCAPYFPQVEKAFELEQQGQHEAALGRDQGADPGPRRQAARLGVLRPVPLQRGPGRETGRGGRVSQGARS